MILFLTAIAILFAAPSPAKKVPPPPHSVDLNTATEKQLEQLPGVGPTTAKAIIEFRAKSGTFAASTTCLSFAASPNRN